MSNKLEFNKINSENDFKYFIRQISTSTILKYIYELSKEVYFGGCKIENISKHVNFFDLKSKEYIHQEIIIQPWQFPDLAYYAIKFSNDYRGIKDLTRESILLILGQTNEFISLKSVADMKDLHSEFDIQLYAYGFGEEQFRYQTHLLFYNRIIRELYIILDISKKCNSKIKPEDIIELETGLSWNILITALFGICLDSFFNDSIHPSIDNIVFDPGIDKTYVFNKIMDYYLVDYDKVRTSKFKRQVFYAKPFVKTQNDGIYTISVYLNQFIAEHALLWSLRNYYLNQPKKHQQDFTDEFGIWFERYFEELCNAFNISKERIKESDTKRADWKLEINGFIFLVEQKSSILPLNVKQQLTDFKLYKETIEKIISKAIMQLDNTKQEFMYNNSIKLILCYDDYINPNILPSYLKENSDKIVNDGRFFIVNIMEMEMLFSLASIDKSLFNIIIFDWLNRNVDGCSKGVSLYQVMRDNGFEMNNYWSSSNFTKYKNLLNSIKDRHIKFQ